MYHILIEIDNRKIQLYVLAAPITGTEECTDSPLTFDLFSGQVPSMTEYKYLDRVKWLEMYGVDLHPVRVSQLFPRSVKWSEVQH